MTNNNPSEALFEGTPFEHADTSRYSARYEQYKRYGLITAAVFTLLLVLSMTVIQISGAVLSVGKVVQTGDNKVVQHATGGPVGEILVKDGDLVQAGDPLIVIDAVAVNSEFDLLKKRRVEHQVGIQRHMAMIAGTKEFELDTSEIAESDQNAAWYSDVLNTQESSFVAQRISIDASIAQLNGRLASHKRERRALGSQIRSNQEQLGFIETSIEDISELFAKKLVSKSRLTNLQREKVAIHTQVSGLQVQIEKVRSAERDAQKQLATLDSKTQEESWREIEKLKLGLADIQNKLNAVSDAQTRLVVSAPATGYVHEMAVQNIDAVVVAGSVIMQIVPIADGPTIETKVKPTDIDQVQLGQPVRVRIDAFDQQTTPEIAGTVEHISADSTIDQKTGEQFFAVTVQLDAEALDSFTEGKLIPGLPASTMFTTNSRSLLSYLLKPFTSQMFKAFRDV